MLANQMQGGVIFKKRQREKHAIHDELSKKERERERERDK